MVLGDIAKIEADALITSVNSAGVWVGAIDKAIIIAAGEFFHDKLAAAPLSDGQAVVVYGAGHPNKSALRRSFKNVIFVVDDLRRPLHLIMSAGLEAAMNSGFKTVTVPTIRMGMARGIVEKSENAVIAEIVKGVADFTRLHPAALDKITFVVYNNRTIAELLAAKFSKMELS